MSGSAGTVVAGNVGVENQRVNIVESRRSVDEQASAVERIIETGIHIFDIRITGDIQNTVIGDVQITEFSNRIIDVESVTTIGHYFSFFRIGIVITGTDPTAVSNVIRADIRVVLHGDSDTVFSINSVIAAHVRADTDLEVGGIDAGPVKDVISGGETDFSAFDIGLVTESDVVHVNPGFTAESFDGKIAFSGDNEHGISVLQSDRIGRKLRVVDVELGSSVPLTAVVAIVNRTGINDGVVCSEGRSFNQQIIGIDVRCGTVGISIAVDGKGGKADLNASDRKGSGALDSVVAVEEISATPILTAGDRTFNIEIGTVVEVNAAFVVGNIKSDIFTDGNGGSNIADHKIPIGSAGGTGTDSDFFISGEGDISCAVVEQNGTGSNITFKLDGGIAAVSGDHIANFTEGGDGVQSVDQTIADTVTVFGTRPGGVDVKRTSFRSLSKNNVTVGLITQNISFAALEFNIVKSAFLIKVDDLDGISGITGGINGDGSFVVDASGGQETCRINGDGSFVHQHVGIEDTVGDGKRTADTDTDQTFGVFITFNVSVIGIRIRLGDVKGGVGNGHRSGTGVRGSGILTSTDKNAVRVLCQRSRDIRRTVDEVNKRIGNVLRRSRGFTHHGGAVEGQRTASTIDFGGRKRVGTAVFEGHHTGNLRRRTAVQSRVVKLHHRTHRRNLDGIVDNRVFHIDFTITFSIKRTALITVEVDSGVLNGDLGVLIRGDLVAVQVGILDGQRGKFGEIF